MVKILKCDLLESEAAYICHQVNCKGVMGAGIAKSISNKWPEVKRVYIDLCNQYPEHRLLGRCQRVFVTPDKTVVNIFGQASYGRSPEGYTSYDALMSAFEDMRLFVDGPIAFPYGFGCGLAMGDWSTVEKLIVNHLGDFDVTICLKE